MNEWEFIDWLKDHFASAGRDARVAMGIGDDMAVLTLADRTLLFGSDMILEGRHFDLDRADGEQIGHKALAVCLSDCAAMAAKPLAAVVSLAKPDRVSPQVTQAICLGLSRTAERFGCAIVGGDTCGWSDGLVVDVALLAETDNGKAILRSGASVGDHLYVTGRLGGSLLGRHLRFTPRIEQARWLTEHLPVTAMIDISDGLNSDLRHLCRASCCGADLDERWLDDVVSDAAVELSATSGRSAVDHALNDGEDFELLLAISARPDQLGDLPESVTLLPVGRTIEQDEICVVGDAGRRELQPGGYRHF